MRSYSINTYMNGQDIGLDRLGQQAKVNKKSADITSPPSKAFVFDEDESSIDDGCFGFAPEGNVWFKTPATRHSSGAIFSFADGHSEYWKWRDNFLNHPNNSNLQRLQAAKATKQS